MEEKKVEDRRYDTLTARSTRSAEVQEIDVYIEWLRKAVRLLEQIPVNGKLKSDI